MRAATHFALWACGLRAAETQTTAAERECLARHARHRRVAAEVGVWHGVTTAVLKQALDPTGTVYAVDPFPKGRLGCSLQRLIARREVGRIDGAEVIWVRQTGAEAAGALRARLLGRVEFVFIDGDHDYEAVRGDWDGWTSLLAGGGIVALHDSVPDTGRSASEGVVQLIREVIPGDPRFELVEQVDTLTVVRARRGADAIAAG
jgi:predicted O-methyltransferase YrrM